MFLRHFGVGFGLKRAALGTLSLAARFVDLLWPPRLPLGPKPCAVRS